MYSTFIKSQNLIKFKNRIQVNDDQESALDKVNHLTSKNLNNIIVASNKIIV